MINQSGLGPGESLLLREGTGDVLVHTAVSLTPTLVSSSLWTRRVCALAIDTHRYCLSKHCCTVAFCRSCFVPPGYFEWRGGGGGANSRACWCRVNRTWRALAPLCSRVLLQLLVWQGDGPKGLTQEQEEGLRYPCVISSGRGHSWATRSVITPLDLSALEPKHR